MTVYRRELYDYAECIDLATLLRGRFPKPDDHLSAALDDITECMAKPGRIISKPSSVIRVEDRCRCTDGRNHNFLEALFAAFAK